MPRPYPTSYLCVFSAVGPTSRVSAEWGGPAAPQWRVEIYEHWEGVGSTTGTPQPQAQLPEQLQTEEPLGPALGWLPRQLLSLTARPWVSRSSCRQGEPVAAGLSASGDPAWPQPSCLRRSLAVLWRSMDRDGFLLPASGPLTLHCASTPTALWSLSHMNGVSSHSTCTGKGGCYNTQKLAVGWQQHCYFSPSTRSDTCFSSDTGQGLQPPLASRDWKGDTLS